ncbi:hypothetical protein [Hyalangium gracile]|uniref:hypothetical protein n=1 Tax=Hyalangium gracile TaxID=394092 RepID=UPI001CCA9701|nr:hypothetical protein [Hyalangium gracile]
MRSADASAPQASAMSPAPAPFDVEAVIRQVHFAYRPEQNGWQGGHSSYEVHADPRGGLTLTPVHTRLEESEKPELLESGEPVSPPTVELETGAPLFLGAAQVMRGDTTVSADEPQGLVEGDGHLSFSHGSVVEHLRNDEEGVEQSWHFASAPDGQGELHVSLPVTGLVFARTTEQGLHFTDARTGMGFRYGHGTWVDGQGRRTAVPAEFSQGRIRMSVPEQVLASAAFPARLEAKVTYEMIIDGQLVAADLAVRSFPALAFNGTNYLLAWRNTRGGLYNIYATRVSSTGTILDEPGLVVSTGPGNSADPQVASNGTDFYVVWSQFQGETWSVRGTVVSSEGVVAEPGGRRLSAAVGSENWPHVASDGRNYLATWYTSGADGTSNVYARRVSSTGQVLDTADIPIATGEGYDETSPVVASNRSVYLVAWSDERGGSSRAYATRVSSDGVVLDPPGGFALSGSSLQYVQAVASNGTNFLAVWLDYRNTGSRDLYASRVTADGAVVDGAGLVVATTRSISESYASVASNGTDYLVAWTAWNTASSTFQNLGCRILASAVGTSPVLDTTSLVLSPNASHKHPVIAPAGSDYLVAWDGTSTATTDLYSARVSASGTVTAGGGFPLKTVSALYQAEPVVASNGTNYLVVWTETGGGTIKIQGARVSREGGVLDMHGLRLTTAARERQAPAVSSNGTDYLVTWMDYREGNWDIYGGRVLGSGPAASAVLDPNGFIISADPAFQNFPAVGSNGKDYLVVWRRDATGRGDVHGARVANTGAVLDPAGIAISTNPVEHYTPRVAFNGTHYLTVWAEYQSATSWDIHGARLTSDGVVLDTSPLIISGGLAEQFEPDVASNGTDFFVVWTDYRSRTNQDIYGARVSGAGVVLDNAGIALCTESVQQSSPRVAFDGANYVAAWADFRWDSAWDVYATQVTAEGTVGAPDGFSVVYNARETEPFVSLASAGGQQSFVVFSRYDTEPNQGSRRARGSFFSFETP